MNDPRSRKRPAEWPKSGWYWHLHHDVLLEWTDDIDERWDYVVREKAEKELSVRLGLMHPVVGQVPERWSKAIAEWDKAIAEWDKAIAEWSKAIAEWDKARAEWDKACAEWDKARAEWDKARAEWDKARAECMPEILALHAAECHGCPWDGKTIFPRKETRDG